jgi:hypothetical protein
MKRVVTLFMLLVGVCASGGCSEGAKAEPVPRIAGLEQEFDDILKKYPDLTFEQLAADVPKREYLERLSFDPATIPFYDKAVKELKLTDGEQEILRRRGFVSVDHDQRYSFGSLYFAVYTRDLPVLVTTDSILHALHQSYDDMLMEMEQTYFTSALDEVLSKCHEELAGSVPGFGEVVDNYRDVDLYLTVARNLLRGAGAPSGGQKRAGVDAWTGAVLVPSKMGQDEQVQEILDLVQSLKLQDPLKHEFTRIYGGQRAIDYSQFQPRGHYTKSAALKRYFRTMMWLGRADTGWNVLPPDRQSGIVGDTPREVRNAALLTQLLQTTGAIKPLRNINHVIELMVGRSDCLTPFQTLELLREQAIESVGELASSRRIEAFQNALFKSELGQQQIRSQVILSDPRDLYQVPPPSVYQLFGQRFAVDSFVLSKVVYDSIIFRGEKVKRTMPTALDVAFVLGNESALALLQEELVKFPYASNLKASREFVGRLPQNFWQENLYHIWLDALRTLTADQANEKHVPEVMRTEAWQRKLLQTQLGSWSQLRHDTVLYAKQSYTSKVKCEYPTGYVEPYPETYARIKFFADEAARQIEATDFTLAGHDHGDIQRKQVEFLRRMAQILGRLEQLARMELAAEPFTAEDQHWLKQLIDIRSRGSGMPQYSGWYCQLFYGGGYRSADWEPTIVDVHTDPNSNSVLEVGVGNCNFLVAAIDNEDDRMIYVGPVYSYYEFHQPVDRRLTDQEWQQMVATGKAPPRPSWTDDFQGPPLKRDVGRERQRILDGR